MSETLPKLVGEWLNEHQNYVYAVARRHASGWEDIEDLSHNIVVFLLTQAKVSEPRTTLEAWVRGHINIAVKLYHYAEYNSAEWADIGEQHHLVASPSIPTRQEDFSEVPVWASLSIEDRMIVRLLDRNYTYPEIGKHMGLARDTIGRRVAGLRKQLADLKPEG